MTNKDGWVAISAAIAFWAGPVCAAPAQNPAAAPTSAASGGYMASGLKLFQAGQYKAAALAFATLQK